MSQQALANAIYAKLADTTTAQSIWSDLSGRIYQMQAPPNAALPLLVFHIHADLPQAYFTGADDLAVEVRLNLWGAAADGGAALTAIHDKIAGLLHHQPVNISGSGSAGCRALDRGRASADGQALRITSRWQIRATAA